MSAEAAEASGLPGAWRPLRLATLVWLRWLAIAGQAASVLFVAFGLGYDVPLLPCLGLIGLSVTLNAALTVNPPGPLRLPVRVATLLLAYDCLQLAGLLALTGGLQNPFSLLLLAPVSVSATTLPQRVTLLLAGLVVMLASLLAIVHLPLPWAPGEQIVFDRVYVIGIWVSILCGVVFIAAYTNRVAHEARQLADALAATELALSRREQLSALDGLAAAAAHELGTPLSTIALAAREMRDEVPEGPLREDVELIISQAARCRAILAKLRNLGADGGDPFQSATLPALLAEVARPHQQRDKQVTIVSRGDGPEPVVERSVGLLYGLGNLIENATDFARSGVELVAMWDDKALSVSITDDGPGYPAEMLARLGEPYLTTRGGEGSHGTGGGLGLGIFIAKTLLERSGARLGFSNADPEGHARIVITWPRGAVEATNSGQP
ncbi:MAG: ActS/PrrB/RegB family redox-sensitive histidine kinase [Devosia sp.]